MRHKAIPQPPSAAKVKNFYFLFWAPPWRPLRRNQSNYSLTGTTPPTPTPVKAQTGNFQIKWPGVGVAVRYSSATENKTSKNELKLNIKWKTTANVRQRSEIWLDGWNSNTFLVELGGNQWETCRRDSLIYTLGWSALIKVIFWPHRTDKTSFFTQQSLSWNCCFMICDQSKLNMCILPSSVPAIQF